MLLVLVLTKAIQTWTDYLANQTDKNFLPTNPSYYSDASSYFSAPGILDFYGNNGKLTIIDIQSFLNSNTDTVINGLFKFSNSSNAYDLFNVSLFNDNSFFSTNDLENNFLFTTARVLARDIETLSVAKHPNPVTMMDVLPEYANFIERFEFHSIEDDGSLTEALSTPDVKLYYPEPFIASPSFVHEDLWFIHVLHYQH